MHLNILLIEDSDHKRVKVIELLREILGDELTLSEAQSFNSGSRAIEQQDFDAVIMDMSLPTYDRSAVESGGRFRTLGGRELARKIIRRRKKTKIVFFTQYDSFSGTNAHTLQSLGALLKEECGENFAALIHYDSSISTWREQLLAALK
jgi:CheY-like chemotaxis protein